MKELSISCTQRSTYPQILYCVLERYTRTPNVAWEERLDWLKTSQEYRDMDRIDGEPMEFEWNIFSLFNTLQLSEEVKSLLLRLSVTPENFTGRIIFMSMFNDISWGSKDNKKNANQVLSSFLFMRRDSEQDNGHSPDLDQRKSGLLSVKTVHKVNGTKWRRRCWNSAKAHTQSSDPRVHCPEEC